jgi:hypothetical protein
VQYDKSARQPGCVKDMRDVRRHQESRMEDGLAKDLARFMFWTWLTGVMPTLTWRHFLGFVLLKVLRAEAACRWKRPWFE